MSGLLSADHEREDCRGPPYPMSCAKKNSGNNTLRNREMARIKEIQLIKLQERQVYNEGVHKVSFLLKENQIQLSVYDTSSCILLDDHYCLVEIGT